MLYLLCYVLLCYIYASYANLTFIHTYVYRKSFLVTSYGVRKNNLAMKVTYA